MEEEVRRRAESWVDDAFAKLSQQLLSGRPGPPQQSLPGLFASTAGESAATTIRILRPYLGSLQHHLDSRCSAAKADVLRALADRQPGPALKAAAERIEDGVRRVLETESTALRNVAALHVVEQLADRAGADDPTVYFVTAADCCAECRRLFWLGDRPRLWLTSELGTGYHKKGDEFPKVGGLHPNCRCSPVYVPKGYGFRSERMAFIGLEHDELAEQRAD